MLALQLCLSASMSLGIRNRSMRSMAMMLQFRRRQQQRLLHNLFDRTVLALRAVAK
jgi:hypothetical protein